MASPHSREELAQVAEHDVLCWGAEAVPVLVEELQRIAGDIQAGRRRAPNPGDPGRVEALVRLAGQLDDLERGELLRRLTGCAP